MAARVRAGLSLESQVDPGELFAHLYARPTPQLVEQAALLCAEFDAEHDVESR